MAAVAAAAAAAASTARQTASQLLAKAQPQNVSAIHRLILGPEYRSYATPLARFYAYSGKLLGASMWFWIMYRAKKDGAVFLGLKHPWDH